MKKTILFIVLIMALLLPFASAAAAPQNAGTCSVPDASNTNCVARLETWCIRVNGVPIACWRVWVPC